MLELESALDDLDYSLTEVTWELSDLTDTIADMDCDCSPTLGNLEYVEGHFRDGQWIDGYHRTIADGDPTNNLSFYGLTNA